MPSIDQHQSCSVQVSHSSEGSSTSCFLKPGCSYMLVEDDLFHWVSHKLELAQRLLEHFLKIVALMLEKMLLSFGRASLCRWS